MKNVLLMLAGTVVLTTACKKKEGCTDPTATNYDPDAEVSDGLCAYVNQSADFTLTSVAVVNGELLDDYKCETADVNNSQASIPLAWSNVPDGTGSMAIIMEHESNGNSYLLLWNIDPTVTTIPHGAGDDGAWLMGANKDGDAISYTSPCSPPGGTLTNNYVITIYALSELPSSLPTTSSLSVDKTTLENAINAVTVVGTATLSFSV